MVKAAEKDPEALLATLDNCLGAVAGAGAPAQLVSPSAFALLRKISLLLAQTYISVTGGEAEGLRLCRHACGALCSMLLP